MVDEQHPPLVDYKDGYGKIDLLVNVRHVVELPPRRADTSLESADAHQCAWNGWRISVFCKGRSHLSQ
jgi:hypothetical protein